MKPAPFIAFPGLCMPTSLPPERELGGTLARPPASEAPLLPTLSSCSPSSGSLVLCPGSSDTPEQVPSYTTKPWPPGPLQAKDSPKRTKLFSPWSFSPFLRECQREKWSLEEINVFGWRRTCCIHSKSIWHKFTEHQLWVEPSALEGIRVESAPSGPRRRSRAGGEINTGISNSYLS